MKKLLFFVLLTGCASKGSIYDSADNCLKFQNKPGVFVESLNFQYTKECSAVTIKSVDFPRLQQFRQKN